MRTWKEIFGQLMSSIWDEPGNQTLIWAQQLRFWLPEHARTRRTFQNSSVPWEKDRVVLGHVLPGNIVWTHGGWQESFGVGLDQIYDACRSRTYQLRALQTKSGFTKRKEVKWQVSRCHVKFCGEFSCPLLLNPVWMHHNPFYVHYPLKIQQLHFLGTQNLPLVEDSHNYLILCSFLKWSFPAIYLWHICCGKWKLRSSIFHLRHELHRRQTWVDQRIQRDVLCRHL